MDERTLAKSEASTVVRGERWASLSHRLAMPAAGGAAVGIGAALAAGVRSPIGAWGPFACVAAGTAALGTAVALHFFRERRDPEAPAIPAPAAGDDEVPEPASPPNLQGDRRPRTALTPAGARVSAYPVQGHPVLSLSTSPGDMVWSHWIRTEPDHLLVPLVGPVPETAFIAPKPGEPAPFAEKEPSLTIDSQHHLVPLPSSESLPGPGPYPVELLDRWFPPDPSASTSSGALGPMGPDVSSIAPPGPHDVFGFPPSPGSPHFDVHYEAITPVPPHLRGTREGPRPGKPRPTSPRGPAPRAGFGSSECATCERELPDLRSWGPCPDCLRPVCSHCLLDALWNHGRGVCGDCALGGDEMSGFGSGPAATSPLGSVADGATDFPPTDRRGTPS